MSDKSNKVNLNGLAEEEQDRVDAEAVSHVLDNLSVMVGGDVDTMLTLLGGCIVTLASASLEEADTNMDFSILMSKKGSVVLKLDYVMPKVIDPTKEH